MGCDLRYALLFKRKALGFLLFMCFQRPRLASTTSRASRNSTRSRSKQTPSGTPSQWRGSTVPMPASENAPSGSPSPLSYKEKREREARPTTLAKIKKEEISIFKASGEKPKVSLVADWVPQRIPSDPNAVLAMPIPEDDWEEEEEGLDKRKRKRGADDAGLSPRAEVRTRSKSADPMRASRSDMHPPAARLDRSSQPGAAGDLLSRRTGRGSVHHAP
ncbi:unnamed protein product [Cochlearia groenlandica]